MTFRKALKDSLAQRSKHFFQLSLSEWVTLFIFSREFSLGSNYRG